MTVELDLLVLDPRDRYKLLTVERRPIPKLT